MGIIYCGAEQSVCPVETVDTAEFWIAAGHVGSVEKAV
jgi:hypothetical protein